MNAIKIESIDLKFHLVESGFRTSEYSQKLNLIVNYKEDKKKQKKQIKFNQINKNLCSLSSKVTLHYDLNSVETINTVCSTFVSETFDSVLNLPEENDDTENLIYSGVIKLGEEYFEVTKNNTRSLVSSLSSEQNDNFCTYVSPEPSLYRHLDNAVSNLGGRSGERWDNCYPLSDHAHQIFIGVAIGPNLQKTLGSSKSRILDYIESVFAQVNLIYGRQLNAYFVVTDVLFYTKNYCSLKTVDHLHSFRLDVNRDFKRRALWHLLDDCPGKAGDANGAAVSQGLCSSFANVGISYVKRNGRTFLLVAHELGHNLAARHSFEEGTGQTGGIMDYGNGEYDNIYQFNSKYRETEICNFLTKLKERGTCNVENDSLFQTTVLSKPGEHCGDGVLQPELNEECECSFGAIDCQCCSRCKLKTFAECDPINNKCCDTTNCRFKPTSHHSLCNVTDLENSNRLGYCSNGECIDDFCSLYGLDFCGIKEDSTCMQQCRRRSSTPSPCPTTDWGSSNNFNSVREGSKCVSDSGKPGVCLTGKCIESNKTNAPTFTEAFPPTVNDIPGLPEYPYFDEPSSDELVLVYFSLCSCVCVIAGILGFFGKKLLTRREENKQWLYKAYGLERKQNTFDVQKKLNLSPKLQKFFGVPAPKKLTSSGIDVVSTPHQIIYPISRRDELYERNVRKQSEEVV